MGGMSDELRRALCSNSMTSMDMEFVPELVGKSELLTDDIRKALCKKIPPRVEGESPWQQTATTTSCRLMSGRLDY